MSKVIDIGQMPAAGRTTDDNTVAALHGALGGISSVCDYAQRNDAQGFNAADTWLGHVLAQMPAGLWSDDAALAAWDMLRKYRGQLASAGIDYDQLPRPAGADELEAGRREEARERARQRAREHAGQWRDQQYRQAHTYLRCDGDGEQVTLAFPYDPGLVDACRTVPGRRYDDAAKANVFPFTSLPAVIELADAHGIEVTPDVRALPAIAAGQEAEHAALPQIRADDDGTIIIDAPFNPGLNQALKDANGGRSTWDRAAKVHRLRARAARELPALADRFGLRVGDQARAAITAETQRQDRNRAAAAVEADPVPVPGLASGMPLKPQQYPVVRFALEHRRVLIGDDMGWGKTLSSLAVVAADGAYPAVVVCRPSLTLNWAAEILRFFPALAVYQAVGTTPQPVPPGTDVVIIGSAGLAAKPRQAGGGGKEFGWVTGLAAAGPKALIIDEGQDTKERAANRSQACEQLAAVVIAAGGLVLDLTGTAILHRPRELCQQLTILGRIGEFGGPKAFLWRYCLSETNQWGASYNGARNLIELHDRLRSWGIMIRRSDDAALGLPPCREHVLAIPEADLDQAVMACYRQAEADLLAYLAEQARKTAQRLGEDPASAAVKAAMVASAAERAEHLVAINTLRQLAGQAKRGYVTGWVREQVSAGEKVMVAAHHRNQVDAYAAEFGGLKLQGGQSVEDKETAKSAFQQLPAAVAPVIAVAIGAGGVGHTLTAARIGIQAEQAWTPGETQQMKKRLHRIGQDRPVDYYITVAESTIDEHLWQVVTTKQATLNAVLDGRSDEGAADDEASIAAELTWRLTQQGLRNLSGDGTAAPGGSSQPGQAVTYQPVTYTGERGSAVTSPDGFQATPMSDRTDRTAARADRETPANGPAGRLLDGTQPLPAHTGWGGPLRPERLLYADGTPLAVRAQDEDGDEVRHATAAGTVPSPPGSEHEPGRLQVVHWDDGGYEIVHPALACHRDIDPYSGLGDHNQARWEAFDLAEAWPTTVAALPPQLVDVGDVLQVERGPRSRVMDLREVRSIQPGSGRNAGGLEFKVKGRRSRCTSRIAAPCRCASPLSTRPCPRPSRLQASTAPPALPPRRVIVSWSPGPAPGPTNKSLLMRWRSTGTTALCWSREHARPAPTRSPNASGVPGVAWSNLTPPPGRPGGLLACAATRPWSPSARTCAWPSSGTPARARPMPRASPDRPGFPSAGSRPVPVIREGQARRTVPRPATLPGQSRPSRLAAPCTGCGTRSPSGTGARRTSTRTRSVPGAGTEQLGRAARASAAAFLQNVQVVVDDAQHPVGQVSAGAVVARFGRDVLTAEDEVIG